jgi:pimeloyl-ACP methyl ester carboxylesterase
VARAILRNLESLIAARERYARINVPVTLVYGDHDWSRPSDRQANVESVPGARYILLPDTGHFTALEAAHEVARILRDDAHERTGPSERRGKSGSQSEGSRFNRLANSDERKEKS